MPSYIYSKINSIPTNEHSLCIFHPEKVLKHVHRAGGGGGGGAGRGIQSNDSAMEQLSLHVHILYIEIVFDKMLMHVNINRKLKKSEPIIYFEKLS